MYIDVEMCVFIHSVPAILNCLFHANSNDLQYMINS